MAENRLRHVRTAIQSRGLDGVLVTSPVNIRYLTGFTGTNGLLVLTARKVVLITDARYALQAKLEARKPVHVIVTHDGLYEEAARRALLPSGSRIGFEAHQVTYAHYRTLRRLFPDVSLVSTRDVVEDGMVVKDQEEIAFMRKAAEISSRVFTEVLSVVRPGVKELDVAAEISYLHRKLGAEGDAFDVIVASGERSAFPHARAGSKEIRNGELVTMDFGCVVGGYHSDITRTIAVGRVSARARRMYDAVRSAQQEALEHARAGKLARDLDAVARKRLAKSGFGRYFQHSLGHGLGLRLHERPRISRLGTEILVSGSVITIEPGVYIPNFGGVRIEDVVLLHERDSEILSNAPRDFLTV